jgi:hypothetical protein
VLPKERRTQLFSATMTNKVAKLQRACLQNPVRIEVDARYTTVETLRQQYIFVPAMHKVGVLLRFGMILNLDLTAAYVCHALCIDVLPEAAHMSRPCRGLSHENHDNQHKLTLCRPGVCPEAGGGQLQGNTCEELHCLCHYSCYSVKTTCSCCLFQIQR